MKIHKPKMPLTRVFPDSPQPQYNYDPYVKVKDLKRDVKKLQKVVSKLLPRDTYEPVSKLIANTFKEILK